MDALRRGGSTAPRPPYPKAVAVDRDIVGLNVDYVAAGGRSVQVLPQTPNALSGDGRRQRVDESHAGIIALGGRRRVGRHRQQGARKTKHQQRSHGAHGVLPQRDRAARRPDRADSHCWRQTRIAPIRRKADFAIRSLVAKPVMHPASSGAITSSTPAVLQEMAKGTRSSLKVTLSTMSWTGSTPPTASSISPRTASTRRPTPPPTSGLSSRATGSAT